jgi:hypothetical protein
VIDPARRAAIAALRQIPPERLLATAQMLGGDAGGMLEGLARVLGQPDEQVEAWLTASGGARPDAATLGALRVLLERVAPSMERLAVLRAAVGRVADAGQRVAEAASAWASERDAELASILARAEVQSATARRDADTLAAVAEDGATLVAGLSSVLEGSDDPEAGLGDLTARVQALEARAARLDGVRERVQELRTIVDDLGAWAVRRGRPDASQLLVLAASLADEHRDPAPSRHERWRRAFDRAVVEGRLDVARAAGQRAQLLAVELGEVHRVVGVAERLADLAEATGDLRAAVLARLESAIAMAQDRGQRAAAVRVAREAVARAEAGDGWLRARASLTLGQVLDRVGDAEGARRAWREAMARAVDHPAELMRAALHLGRSQAAHQPHQARKSLGLARELAERHGEPGVLSSATAALLSLEPVDEQHAGAWVRMARAALGDTPGWAALREALVARHGAARVAGWVGGA